MESYKYYGDIIELPRHISKRHTPMNIQNRAAQFAPFSALTGHNDEVMEKARLTEDCLSLDEEEKERINYILQNIIYNINNPYKVSIKYFIEDKRKSGGRFNKVTGSIRKIDTYNRLIYVYNEKINIDDIVDITLYDDENI